MTTTIPPSDVSPLSFRDRVMGPPMDKSKAEHVGVTGNASEEETSPPDRPSIDETMKHLQEEGFQIHSPPKHQENSAQPDNNMTTPASPPTDHDEAPSTPYTPPLRLNRSGKAPWYKRYTGVIVKMVIASTIVVFLIFLAVRWIKPNNKVEIESQALTQMANEKDVAVAKNAGLLTELSEAKAKAAAVEELRAELARVKKLAEKPVDVLTILADPMVQVEIEKIVAAKIEAAKPLIAARAVDILQNEAVKMSVKTDDGTIVPAITRPEVVDGELKIFVDALEEVPTSDQQ